MTEQHSAIWWLWHNKFFETTPLTGYGFINGAKRLVEVLFWYGLIMVFTVFTIYNVHSLLRRYNSNPTKTEVRIASNALDATIKNFTLKLRLPMSEMEQSIPSWESHQTVDLTPKPFLCDVKRLISMFEDAHHTGSECLLNSLYPLVKGYDDKTEYFLSKLENMRASRSPCRKMAVGEWNEQPNAIYETDKVIENLEQLYSEKLTSVWAKLTEQLFNEENEFQLLTMQYLSKEAYNKFMSTIGTAKGYYIQRYMNAQRDKIHIAPYLLLSAMSDEAIKDYLPFLGLVNVTKFFEMEGLSAEKLVDIISSRLLNIAPFNLPPNLGDTKFHLRDWKADFLSGQINIDYNQFSFGGEEKTPDELKLPYNVFGDSFTTEYLVEVPEGTKQFNMDIYPPKQLVNALFVLMHLDKFIFDGPQAPMQVLFHLMIACRKAEADIDSKLVDEASSYWREYPRATFLEWFIDPLLELYRSRSELQLHTGSGYITMKPFANYFIKYLPIGRIISDTDMCTSMGLTECLDLCQSNYTLKNCDCFPWNLKYLHGNSDKKMCFQPCPGLEVNRDVCLEKCEAELAHPCDHVSYRPEIVSKTSTRKSLEQASRRDASNTLSHDYVITFTTNKHPLTNEFKLFTLNVDVEQVFAYSKTIESYEMSFTQLISEFGGLVDFWLGVNVIGIIHAILYFLKQFLHCGAKDKTGRTVRRLFGRDKIHTANTSERNPGSEKQVVPLVSILRTENEAQQRIMEQKVQNMELRLKILEKRLAEEQAHKSLLSDKQ